MTNDPDPERAFEAAADAELTSLLAKLDELELDLEVELSMGILTVEFPDATKYVVNSHRAARQIWMAAERNAWHFDRETVGESTRWIAKKSSDELRSTLGAVLARKTGRAVDLA